MRGIMIAHPLSAGDSAAALNAMTTKSALHPRTAERLSIFGREIRVDLFDPAESGPASMVLLFHGIGGLLGDGALMRRAARALAAEGFRAGIVHYFNATGTLFATHTHVRDHAGDWKSAIADVSRHYFETHGPVGLLGYSLGGFLSVHAAMETSGIGAVAVLSGGLLAEHEHHTPSHLPPLLVLHGSLDAKIPPERAEALQGLGRRAGARVESIFFPGEGHTFAARAERDALACAARFFAARLGAGAPP